MRDWLPFPWGKSKKTGESVDVEKYLKTLRIGEEGFIEEEGVTYVKPINLAKDSAVEDTAKELLRGNIVILNIADMLPNPIALNDKVSRIREHCISNGGDVCKISEIKLMIVPQGVEIAYPPSSQEA